MGLPRSWCSTATLSLSASLDSHVDIWVINQTVQSMFHLLQVILREDWFDFFDLRVVHTKGEGLVILQPCHEQNILPSLSLSLLKGQVFHNYHAKR